MAFSIREVSRSDSRHILIGYVFSVCTSINHFLFTLNTVITARDRFTQAFFTVLAETSGASSILHPQESSFFVGYIMVSSV